MTLSPPVCRPPSKRLPYAAQLKTPEWKRLSHTLKEEAGWKCEECGAEQSATANLEVHHVFYVTGLPAAKHPRCLLMVLCPTHHQERQTIEQRILQNVAEYLRTKSIPEMENQPFYALVTE